MTEYIDRDDVRLHCSSYYCSNGDVCNFCESNVIEYPDFMKIPPADVVEREKYDLLKRQLADSWNRIDELDKLNGHMREQINKAIEEINNAEIEVDFMNDHADGFNSGLFKALEILERNMGE